MYSVYAMELGVLPTLCYIVCPEGGGVCAVVDPACDAAAIKDRAAGLGLSIGAVLLTHGHFDHIGAAEELAAGGIPVYLHPLDRPMLADPSKNGSEAFGLPAVVCAADTTGVADGDTVRVGDMSFSVMHTPGHTPGSVCYLFDGGIFTGDTMFRSGYGRTDLWGGSFPDMIASLRRLAPYRRNSAIYPGHGD